MNARPLRIACLQTRPRPDFAGALGEALALAEAAVAEGARFLALPEYCGGLRTEGAAVVPPTATEAEHPVLAGLADFAAGHGVWMLIGSLAIPGPEGRLRNRSILLDDTGRIRARYDKIHLFDVSLSGGESYRESAAIRPGDCAVTVEAAGWRLGLSICYDLRFPQLYRDLAGAGARILTVPSAFTVPTGAAHWEVLLRARAVETGCFVLAPAQTGHHARRTGRARRTYGHSLAVDPSGEVLADAGEAVGITLVEIGGGEAMPPMRDRSRISGTSR